MAIVVLRELRKEPATDSGPGDADSRIAAVHAAPTELDALGDVNERTFCGQPTLDMERVAYEPPEPGAAWLPPDMKPWECANCAEALRSL